MHLEPRRPVSPSETPCRHWSSLAAARHFAQAAAVIRKAFRMAVDPGEESEYERRHRPVWPELEAALVEHGVSSYSIFLDPETNDLFGYAEIECEEQWHAIASTEVCRRWWGHMRDLMPTNPDDSPVSRDLREVFHIGRV
jgi:L-rhamnose mutarotase